jgi:hypothetical protein
MCAKQTVLHDLDLADGNAYGRADYLVHLTAV